MFHRDFNLHVSDDEIEYISVCLLVTWIFSFVKCPKSFTYFSISWLFLTDFRNSFYFLTRERHSTFSLKNRDCLILMEPDLSILFD